MNYLKLQIYNIINFIFPHTCIMCNKIVHSKQYTGICLDCHKNIKWFNINQHPFLQKQVLENNIKQFDSLFIYNDAISRSIINYKFNDETQLGKIFANLLKHKAKNLIQNNKNTIIIPVPIHKKRLLNRKYNQASIIAKHLAKILKTEYSNNGLKRVKNTPHQTGQSAIKRNQQLKNAFLAERTIIKNKNILLIDDVLTTGSTINLCVKELLEKGAESVKVLTIAYTEK